MIANRLLLPAAAAALLALFRPPAAVAQGPCRGDVQPDGMAYGYRRQSDRCEGGCGWLASNTTALRVVGFSRGPVFPSHELPPRLAVQWVAPAAPGGTLRVSAVRGPRCYQMDADAPTNQFSWSSRIVEALGVQPARLAAVVYVQGEMTGHQEKMMVPAEPIGARMPDQTLAVELVPGRAFDRVTFTIERAADGAVIIAGSPLQEAWFPANEPIRFRLPPNLPREVPLRLRIVGEHESGSNSMDQLFWLSR